MTGKQPIQLGTMHSTSNQTRKAELHDDQDEARAGETGEPSVKSGRAVPNEAGSDSRRQLRAVLLLVDEMAASRTTLAARATRTHTPATSDETRALRAPRRHKQRDAAL